LPIPGITAPYHYLSHGVTAFGAHVEDLRLPSTNVVVAGAPKLWVLVPPSARYLLERLIFPPRAEMGASTTSKGKKGKVAESRLEGDHKVWCEQRYACSSCCICLGCTDDWGFRVRGLELVLSPKVLAEYHIPYSLLLQDVNTCVFTMGTSYHCGFNTGSNEAIAINVRGRGPDGYGCDCMEDGVTREKLLGTLA